MSVDGSLEEGVRLASEVIGTSEGIHRLQTRELEHVSDLWAFGEGLPPSLQQLESLTVDRSCFTASALDELLTSLLECKDSLLELYVTDGDLSHFPDAVTQFTALKRLDLSYSGSWKQHGPMRHLPNELTKLTSLEALYLKHQSLKDVTPVWGLRQLRTLHLSGFQSPIVTERIGDLSASLTDLDITVGRGVTPSFFLLTNLTALDLRCLDDSPIPSQLEVFSQLTRLRLSWSVEEDVDTAMKRSLGMFDGTRKAPPSPFGFLAKMTRLEELFIHSRSMLTYPEGFLTLSSLRVLEMPGDIHSIPPQISLLQSLETLSIAPGCLYHISDALGSLSRLQFLRIENCMCSTLPEAIGDLSQLQELSFTAAGLEEIPESIGDLQGLHSLRVTGCSSLTAIPATIGRLTSLRMLEISSCPSVRDIPREIGLLTNVEVLNLSNLGANAFPDEMGHLGKLRSLIFDDTEITVFPKDMGGLTSLKELSLTNTETPQLSEGIFSCVPLRELNLMGIWVETLSDSIGHMTNLTKLTVRNTAVKSLPEALCQLGGILHFEFVDCCPFSFPPHLFNHWVFLTVLHLDDSPPLPHELGLIQALEVLRVSFADVDDLSAVALPDTFHSRTLLEKIHLRGAYGPLPRSLVDARSLRELYLYRCLSSEVPDCWANLQATEFSLSVAPNLSSFPAHLLLMPYAQAITISLEEETYEYGHYFA